MKPPSQEVFEDLATTKGIDPSFVEKDWFVAQVIAIIESLKDDTFHFVFTGGTALSKAHGLLKRFSEDIDFRIIGVGKDWTTSETKRKLSELKKKITKALEDAGFKDLQIQARDSNRFFSISLNYKTYFKAPRAIRPHILIELTARPTQLTPIKCAVSSFVNEAMKKPAEVEAIDCIEPLESAADKLSALAWRVPDRVRGSKDDDPAIVRHIYDLAILESHIDAKKFKKIVKQAMAVDQNRATHDKAVNDLTPSEKIARALEILEADGEYPNEYDTFVGSMLYAMDSPPTYKKALKAVKKLTEIAIS